MNKTTFFLLLFLVLCVTSSAPVAAKEAPQFGYINVAQAVAFHPLMALLDIKSGRFHPNALGLRAPKEKADAREALITKRKKLLEDRKLLGKQIEKINDQFKKRLGELSGLQAKINSLPEQSRTPVVKQYNKKKALLDQEFWAKREKVELELDRANSELESLKTENALLHLTTIDETQQVFKIMLDDIFTAVDAVSEHYKVAFVFNSSFTIERTPSNPKFTPVNPMGEFFKQKLTRPAKDILLKHGENGQAPMYTTFTYWNGCQRWAFQNCMDSRLDRMFIKGGVNMTPAVVDYVLQKHKIDKYHRDVLQTYFELETTRH